MSWDRVKPVVDQALDGHDKDAQSYKRRFIGLIIAIIIFGILGYKISVYFYFAYLVLGPILREVLKQEGKLPEIRVRLIDKIDKLLARASNQIRAAEEIRREKESEKQRGG